MPYSDYWEDLPGDELPSHIWDSPSPVDSLTLPPITNTNYDDLSFNDAQYFDALPRLPSPDPFGAEPASNSNSQSTNDPPPSNQQARRHPPPAISQYRVAGSESPDPFEDFIDLTPPPEMGNTRSRNTARASPVVDLTDSSPARTNNNNGNDMAPNLRKRKASSTPGEERATKTARASPRRKTSIGDVAVVDLSNVEDEAQYEAMKKREQEEAIKKQNEEEANRPVKLAEFQCIICMDNPTDLTVTHCGHLFCSECLHQALYAGDKKCCPVCRTMISIPRTGAKPSKNGVFALEMKLMTANKKGKRAIRPGQGLA